MLSELSDLEPLVRERLPPEKYGFKSQLMGKISKDANGYFVKIRGDDPKQYGWACLESALAIKDIVAQKLGTDSGVYGGADEYGIFRLHTFLLVKEPFNTIIDGVPIYRFTDSCHGIEITMPEEFLRKTFREVMLRDGFPVSFSAYKGSEFCTNFRMLTEITNSFYKLLLATYRIVDFKPTDVVETVLFLHPEKVKNKISEMGKNPTVEEIKERFEQIEKTGIGSVHINGGGLDLICPQKKVALGGPLIEETKKIHEQDYDMLSNIVEQILFS